jgi:hypothetical protein
MLGREQLEKCPTPQAAAGPWQALLLADLLLLLLLARASSFAVGSCRTLLCHDAPGAAFGDSCCAAACGMLLLGLPHSSKAWMLPSLLLEDQRDASQPVAACCGAWYCAEESRLGTLVVLGTDQQGQAVVHGVTKVSEVGVATQGMDQTYRATRLLL